MRFERILASVDEYYSAKIREHGPSARGVDWNSPESQMLRFEKLLSVCDLSALFTINDYGCGYGALVDFMTERGFSSRYCGFDVSEEMISQAERLHQGLENCKFVCEEAQMPVADFTIASGIFNVKLRTGDEEWQSYMVETAGKLNALSSRGFSFNALSIYSDREKMRPDLHYADPLFWFNHCKTNFSRYVALLHDYRLYEFTIVVRR